MELRGGHVDPFMPIVMAKMLGHKISIYMGKDVWHSDEDSAMDLVFAYIERNFMPTKAGEAGC